MFYLLQLLVILSLPSDDTVPTTLSNYLNPSLYPGQAKITCLNSSKKTCFLAFMLSPLKPILFTRPSELLITVPFHTQIFEKLTSFHL